MNTDSSQFITGREVAVLDMLNARDRRHAIQQELIRTHNATVISFTLNIPGPIKVFPLGEMTFEEGVRLIDSQPGRSRSLKNGRSAILQETNSSGLLKVIPFSSKRSSAF